MLQSITNPPPETTTFAVSFGPILKPVCIPPNHKLEDLRDQLARLCDDNPELFPGPSRDNLAFTLTNSRGKVIGEGDLTSDAVLDDVKAYVTKRIGRKVSMAFRESDRVDSSSGESSESEDEEVGANCIGDSEEAGEAYHDESDESNSATNVDSLVSNAV